MEQHTNFWLLQMLGNFGAKQNLYFLPPSLFKKHSHTTVLLYDQGELKQEQPLMKVDWTQ